MDFLKKLDLAVEKNNSLLCVGLDPDPQKTKGSLFAFNKKIIDQTAPFVCAFKPQIAFYEARGTEGLKELKKTIDYIKSNYPLVPIIIDAKRGDVSQTAKAYAKYLFEVLRADAATVNPYLGYDSLEPFLEYKDRGVIVLCRTSNPTAGDFQDLKVGKNPLYLEVASKVSSWSKKHTNLLMVVGATWPRQLQQIRKIAPQMTFLVPGVGAQGGDLEGTLKNGLNSAGKGLIISSSRGIIYSQDPAKAAQTLQNEINSFR